MIDAKVADPGDIFSAENWPASNRNGGRLQVGLAAGFRSESAPNDIDDKKPKWETFRDALDEGNRLLEEHAQLLTFQEKLDEARDRLDSGQITKKELEGIKSDLAAEMPDAVREKLGIEQPKTDAAPKHDVAANETVQPPNMDNLMQQTGFAPLTPKR